MKKYIPRLFGRYINTLFKVSKKKAVEKAFLLFCTPQKGRVKEFQKKFLDSAKFEKVESNNITLQTYKWEGEKETVLLLHGWESNVYRWRNLLGFLKEAGYNIVAIDAPGHGNSTGDILHVPIYTKCANDIITKYKPKYVIGHSVGGMTTLYNQYKHPNNSVEKIVSLGAPSELSEIMKHYENLLQLNDNVVESLEAYFIEKFNIIVNEFSIASFVKNSTVPGLIIHDKFDKIAPFSAAKSIHKNWKNSTLVETEGLGHSLHQDDVNKQVISFLEQ
ncbi:alpha/beta hydrolase [Cellulophaga baltica]|uniref:alpha/beta fold hydrolase n=1 Tax=Cellulophaga TaxID=104264 RepID=UPI001C078094|nr:MULTISPECIES: alpha/beta hydrolase [Cellulophaga]MBU2997023.1 alpha/beta hydrolase [Cellulophaga baltica]MDO6768421.1 alpha/beta hydrolase [Cellulophaga sp. 1_MG-2023]